METSAMKKSLLALAVLATAAGGASAQSSVTIYGKVDLGLVLDSGGAAGKSVRVSSGVTGGSRLGFKGVEDLGGGLKAAFQFETGFCADMLPVPRTSVPAATSSWVARLMGR
jgi:predicted porin